MSASLCIEKNGTIDCSQPSFAILDKWDQLDFNHDGLWSRQEAVADDANLACVMGKGITTEQVFNAIGRGLKEHAVRILKHEATHEFNIAISKADFDLWRGLAVMCSARDVNRCSQLILDGIFDGAFKVGGFLLENALDVCGMMLESGGVCESAHPITYVMWQQLGTQMCGAPRFNGGELYENPENSDDGLDLLFIDYMNISKFGMANTLKFQFFVYLILFVWYVNLLHEFGDIVDLVDFAIHFPTCYRDPFNTTQMIRDISAKSGALFRGQSSIIEEADEVAMHITSSLVSKDESIRITAISGHHKVTIWIMVAVRTFVMIYLACAGTVFIFSTFSFIDLLLNAVALAFVFELPVFLYNLLVGDKEKHDLAKVEPLEYTTTWPKGKGISGMLQSNVFWGLVIFPMLAVSIVAWNAQRNTAPIYEALKCACFQVGDRCLAADTLNRDWWTAYWKVNRWV